MIPGLTDELKIALFANAAPYGQIWIGEVYEFGDSQELIPLRFDQLDFLAIFSSPANQAGGDEMLLAMAEQWAAGFVPDQQARLIKFWQANAQARALDPKEWHLGASEQIFEFLTTLADVMVTHATTCEFVTQYFFWPASESLARAYVRVFRSIDKKLMPGAFKRILREMGDFYGYQRT